MKTTTLFILGMIFISVTTISCLKVSDVTAPANPADTSASTNPSLNALLNAKIPGTFTFKTYDDVSLNITLLAPDNTPLSFVMVDVLDKPASQNGQVEAKEHGMRSW